MTPILLYGLGAKEKADRMSFFSFCLGKFGAEKLKVEEAKLVQEKLNIAVVGYQANLVIGPLDEATPKAVESFLKVFEDYVGSVTIILWANDLAGIPKTILSRVHTEWVASVSESEVDDSLVEIANLIMIGDKVRALELLSKTKLTANQVIATLSELLVGSVEGLKIWESIRPLTLKNDPTTLGLIASLI